MQKDDIIPINHMRLISATIDYTDEEFGSYLRLLIKQFDAGFIPTDMQKLKKLSDSIEKNSHILSKFKEVEPGKMQNSVMEDIRETWENDFIYRPRKKKLLGRKKENSNEKPHLVYPYESEAFMRVWSILIKQKKWKNKSFEALQGSLKQLSEYEELTAIAMMQKTINAGWQGLFEQRENFKQTNFNGQQGNTGAPKSRIGNSRHNQEQSRELDDRAADLFSKIESANSKQH